MGTAAIQQLLKLIETETEESVLSQMFIALANMDDSSMIPAFSATMGRLKKPTLYLAIREISLLRPTNTRNKMISILQSFEATLDAQIGLGDPHEIGNYYGRQILKTNLNVLDLLEKQLSRQIPVVTRVKGDTFGAVVEDKQVVELGLSNIHLAELPDSLGDLTSLRSLWMTDNQIKALPESFGNLVSLKELLMQWNEITSLPDCIVNLNKLEFIRMDEKVKTNISESVTNWLEKQEKLLGGGRFLWD